MLDRRGGLGCGKIFPAIMTKAGSAPRMHKPAAGQILVEMLF
jgi:hypothetical protein